MDINPFIISLNGDQTVYYIQSGMEINPFVILFLVFIIITEIWYVQIPPRLGHLEMILIDSKGDKIQVFVRKEEFNEWEKCLVENKTYVMHNFNVSHNELQFKKEFPDIPEKEYDFKFFGDILPGNYRTYLLIDIIGVFHKLIFSQTEASFKKIIFSLRDFSGDVINCTLWESHAMKFMNYYNNQPIREPMIILLTHARVKEGQGHVVITN
ncbi:hypothetical protein Lal_00016749 [Lupinus albus]|nr:hypothetical protein Lal_00016749 [Lupinus albus]